MNEFESLYFRFEFLPTIQANNRQKSIIFRRNNRL